MEYSFHIYNKMATDGITLSTDKILNDLQGKKTEMRGAGTSLNKNSPLVATGKSSLAPVVVCVGSDLAIGDSLGPIVGSLLQYKTQGTGIFLYGTLAAPITAKEIKYVRSFLKKTHPDRQIIAVDAAVGGKGDIGVIRVCGTPLLPGAGANKQLGALGDISILGIVAEKTAHNYGILNTTRLNFVYSMAEIISESLSTLLWERGNRAQSACKNA